MSEGCKPRACPHNPPSKAHMRANTHSATSWSNFYAVVLVALSNGKGADLKGHQPRGSSEGAAEEGALGEESISPVPDVPLAGSPHNRAAGLAI